MIENIVTHRLWAESLTESKATNFTTIYLANEIRRPRVTAEISLSRLHGSGTAKAFIWSYEYQRRWDPEPINQPLEPPHYKNDPSELVDGVSQYTFDDAISVTFGITVTNMFAYANCTVFIYEGISLRDMLLSPVRLFDWFTGP